jgi:DNA (cytosine-5)-methyltransferase 1
VFKPRWLVIENVVHMRTWSRYEEFLARLRSAGYNVRPQVLNAADFGVPQSRRRLFITADRECEPPQIALSKRKRRAAAMVLEKNGKYAFSDLRKDGRAEATLDRAQRAIDMLGNDAEFLMVYYGSDAAGGWQRLSAPLRTITTLDRFALVRPTATGHEMRMLQVDELKRAMGFPARFKLQHGTRRDKVKMLGNAVCPPVMEAVVRQLTKD